MKNIDILAENCQAASPALTPQPEETSMKLDDDMIGKIAARVVDLLQNKQTDPELPEPEPEEAGGEENADDESGEMG